MVSADSERVLRTLSKLAGIFVIAMAAAISATATFLILRKMRERQ